MAVRSLLALGEQSSGWVRLLLSRVGGPARALPAASRPRRTVGYDASDESRLDGRALAWTTTMGLVLLASFAIRTFRLGAQSLWYDEGISLHYASADPVALVSLLAELGEFPPLYFLTLHSWMSVAGQTELALRLPSALAGTLAIALTYQLGRRLVGGATGIAAASLLAVSPLHVWQSQETRMYTLAVALGLVATYVFVRILAWPRGRLLVAYALLIAAGLYTHFTFAFVVLAHGVCLGCWLAARPARRRVAARAVLAIVGGLALFSPWLPLALRTYQTNATYWPGRLDPVAAGGDTLAAFVAGELAYPTERTTLALVGGAAILLGLLAGALRSRDAFRSAPVSPGLLLACWLVIPAVAMGVMLLDRPKFAPRYLLVALPPFCLLAGRAAAVLPSLLLGSFSSPRSQESTARRAVIGVFGVAGLALGLAFAGAGAWSSRAQALEPSLAREDVRGLASYLAREAGPDDAILLLGGHVQVPFTHYYYRAPDRPGLAPVYPLPDSLLPSVADPIGAEDLVVLNRIVPGRRRIWVVRWQDRLADPAGLVVQQLELAGRRVDAGRAFHGLHLDAFAVVGSPTFPIAFEPRHPLRAAFDNGVSLLGFDLEPRQARPGEKLRLTLYWRVESGAGRDYVTFAQLLNGADHIYGQHDKPPVSEVYGTSRWQPGEAFKDEYELWVRPGTPPGEYRVQVGLYDRATLQRVPVTTASGGSDDRLILADVPIVQGEPLGPGADSLRRRVAVDVAPGIRLIGYETEPEHPRAGEPVRIVLLWHATSRVENDYRFRLALRSRDGRELVATEGAPADGSYPTSRWRPDDVVRDIHNLAIPADLVPGEYVLAVATSRGGTRPAVSVEVGRVVVR